MKTRTRISGITKEDLVNLFADIMYGSEWLDATYHKPYISAVENECIEEKMANSLLNGYEVTFFDCWAEDEHDKHGNNPDAHWDNERQCIAYPIILEDVKKGLENAIDGRFKCYCNESEWTPKAVRSLINQDGKADLTWMETLMQIILFNEVVY